MANSISVVVADGTATTRVETNAPSSVTRNRRMERWLGFETRRRTVTACPASTQSAGTEASMISTGESETLRTRIGVAVGVEDGESAFRGSEPPDRPPGGGDAVTVGVRVGVAVRDRVAVPVGVGIGVGVGVAVRDRVAVCSGGTSDSRVGVGVDACRLRASLAPTVDRSPPVEARNAPSRPPLTMTTIARSNIFEDVLIPTQEATSNWLYRVNCQKPLSNPQLPQRITSQASAR